MGKLKPETPRFHGEKPMVSADFPRKTHWSLEVRDFAAMPPLTQRISPWNGPPSKRSPGTNKKWLDGHGQYIAVAYRCIKLYKCPTIGDPIIFNIIQLWLHTCAASREKERERDVARFLSQPENRLRAQPLGSVMRIPATKCGVYTHLIPLICGKCGLWLWNAMKTTY